MGGVIGLGRGLGVYVMVESTVEKSLTSPTHTLRSSPLTSHLLLLIIPTPDPSAPDSRHPHTVLADRLAQFVHFFTLNYSLRPFGASAVVAGHDAFQGTHELYVVEPSGVSYVRALVVGG